MSNAHRLLVAALILVLPCMARAGVGDGRLDIYFVDVEGGAATLIVTPAGESLLVDSGNPGARDAGRIVEAAKAAGLKQIDHLVTTHYHVDHLGGAPELAKSLPIRNIYDNGDENPAREKRTPEYLAIPAEKRIVLNPGDLIPLKDVQNGETQGAKLAVKCIAARKQFIAAPAGAKPNPVAGQVTGKPQDLTDNANSIVLLLSFGGFRFFDAGDLTWNVEYDLVAPVNRVGTVDVYQVTHHGLDQSNNPAVIKALAPTVAIMNNGTTKGCGPEVCATLKGTTSVQAVYQGHKNLRPDGNVNNTADELIANLERECKGNLIKLSVAADGKSYSVSIPGNGHEKTYQTRQHE